MTNILHYIYIFIISRFSLKDDKADNAIIDDRLRAGIHMRGTKLWNLMCAIFIASIGLSLNSTATIIGAMLISPLMEPIIGLGYGVGIYDFQLIRSSLKNLAIAIIISLLASTVYFLFSPSYTDQSELLARTTPEIWDILIALFGGFAGIIGMTRKEKSNVIPGVAIATALMPPLCTAGFGLANGNWSFFCGALYLFIINSVFVSLASIIVVRILKMQMKSYVDEQVAKRIKRYITVIVLITILPSLYLAYILTKKEVSKAQFEKVINEPR